MLMAHPNVAPYVCDAAHPEPRDVEPEPGVRRARRGRLQQQRLGRQGRPRGRRQRDHHGLRGARGRRRTRTSARSAIRRCSRSRSSGLSARARRTARRLSDGVLAPQVLTIGQNVFNPDTVFGYYPADNPLPGNPSLLGPEFGIQSALTALRRANLVNTLVYSTIPTGTNNPNGTSLDLSGIQTLAANPAAMVEELNQRLCHGLLSASAKTAIVTAVNAVPATNAAPARPTGDVSRRDVLTVPGREVAMTNRRDFLKLSCGAFGLAAFEQSLDRFGLHGSRRRGVAAEPVSGARVHLHVRRQRLEQHGHPRERRGHGGIQRLCAARGASLALRAARGHGLRGRASEHGAQLRRASRRCRS